MRIACHRSKVWRSGPCSQHSKRVLLHPSLSPRMFTNQIMLSWLVELHHVDEVQVQLEVAQLCFRYLCFEPTFDDHLFDTNSAVRKEASDETLTIWAEQVRDYVLAGDYAFADYAIACWLQHLEDICSMPKDDLKKTDGVDEMIHACVTFIEKYHFLGERQALQSTRSANVIRSLTALRVNDRISIEELTDAIEIAVKQSDSKGATSAENEAFRTLRMCASIRNQLESIGSGSQQIRKHYGTFIYKCPQMHCQGFHAGFESREARDNHVKKHDPDFFCSESGCPRHRVGFPTRAQFEEHMRDAHGVGFTDSQFATRKHLKRALNEGQKQEEEGDKELKFRCTYDSCGKGFTRKHNLKDHVARDHESKEKRHFCPRCKKAFYRAYEKDRHQETMYSGKPFACLGRMTIEDDDIPSDIDDSAPEPGKRYWGCGLRFKRSDALRQHIRGTIGHSCYRQLLVPPSRRTDIEVKKRNKIIRTVRGYKCQGFFAPKMTDNGALSFEPEQWGCGKTFEDLDAFKRHYKSPAGYRCMKVLLDEATKDEVRQAKKRAEAERLQESNTAAQASQGALSGRPPDATAPTTNEPEPVNFSLTDQQQGWEVTRTLPPFNDLDLQEPFDSDSGPGPEGFNDAARMDLSEAPQQDTQGPWTPYYPHSSMTASSTQAPWDFDPSFSLPPINEDGSFEGFHQAQPLPSIDDLMQSFSADPHQGLEEPRTE